MGQKELVNHIIGLFREANMDDHWICQDFKKLYDRNQLIHFQIFEMNWFPGADRILSSVDELHSMMTPKRHFIAMAEMLGLEFPASISKEALVGLIKKQKNWKIVALDFESQQSAEARKECLAPIYEGLEDLGYYTNRFPKQIRVRTWIVEAVNEKGRRETVYLNKSPNGETVMIQSTFQSFVGTIEDKHNSLVPVEI